MTLIAPSILSADFGRLAEEIGEVDRAGADWLHVDVMDAHFVDNLTIGPVVVEGVRKATRKPLDVHLMIEDPERYAPRFRDAGADYITVHQEIADDLEAMFLKIEETGAKPGVAINPGTPVETVLPLIDRAALIVVMSVNPGWGGQPFMEVSIDKLSALREAKERTGSSCLIEIDGGIKPTNARRVIDAGAEVLVAGSAVFGSNDYPDTIAKLRDP